MTHTHRALYYIICTTPFSVKEHLLCCDSAQINTLTRNLQLANQLLSRCPACEQNFYEVFCRMTCDPKQNSFLKVITTRNATNSVLVTGIDYAISVQFADGMYNSCVNVQGVGGELAIKSLCNTDVKHCSPEHLLSYLGDPNQNPNTPLLIQFNVTEVPWQANGTTLHPMNHSTLHCSESCSCQDCVEACPPLPSKTEEKHWTIFGVDGISVVMYCIFVSFLLFFAIAEIWRYILCPALDDDDPLDDNTLLINGSKHHRDVGDVGCCQSIGAWVENKFEHLFEKWGLFCAKHPAIVIATTVVLCAALSSGIVSFTVITDPVELWSSPNCRARREMDYFNENFT